MMIKKANIDCETCGYMLLIKEDKVFCQHCKNPDGTNKQIKPKYDMYIPK